MGSPNVTEAVLRTKLGMAQSGVTREGLIDVYLKHVRKGICRDGGQSPRRKASKKKSDGKKAGNESESKSQMLDRLRSQAEALCKSKKSDTIEIDGSSFRLIKVFSFT